MPFDTPPPPDPYNRPWLDVLHLRAPEHGYLSESRWRKKRAAAKRKNKKKQSPPDTDKD